MNLQELMHEHKAALDVAESTLTVAEAAGRQLTDVEQQRYELNMKKVDALSAQIGAKKRQNTILSMIGPDGVPTWVHSGTTNAEQVANPLNLAAARNPEYAVALHAFIKTGGKAHTTELLSGSDGQGGYRLPGSEAYTRQRLPNGQFATGWNAASYEGSEGNSGAAGGFAVNVQTEQIIKPLAVPDLGIFDAATVIPTSYDMHLPVQASFGTSAIKAESTGTIATFGGTDPTLGQVKLDSYMAGALRLASFELLQDVNTFQQFVVEDLIRSQRILEGSLLAAGTGTGQAQGVFGNTGTGSGTTYALTGTASTDGPVLLNALFDVVASLKSSYQANASWVMSRATALALRKAQFSANAFNPIITVDADGTTRILGRPVYFDVNAPALPTATTSGVLPILYGDFKAGYVVGVRGGSGINVKLLDQPWAAQGQVGILAYRRLDGRIWLQEAIQQIRVSHS